jgi:hypothetical protein
MYTITIGKNKNAAVEVYLDTKNPKQPNPSAIPPHVGLGTGDKKKRYKDYLGKCFNDNSNLLRYMAFLHKTGKEKGSITLIAKHILNKIHTEGVKEFLEENRETLDAILPYVFPGEGYKAPETEAPAAVPQGSSGQMTLEEAQASGKISATDMAQIQDLIRQDQAQQALSATEACITAESDVTHPESQPSGT